MDCSESEWSLLGYPLHSPLSPSLLLPCVAVCHQIPFPLLPLWHDVTEDIRHQKRRGIVRNVPTHTASHTEDRNHDVKIDHCNSMADIYMGQNVAKKITHGIWCMIFPKKETKMSQPHGFPSQFQISSRKLIEYRSTPAEHKFSEGSVDLFSRGRFITET